MLGFHFEPFLCCASIMDDFVSRGADSVLRVKVGHALLIRVAKNLPGALDELNSQLVSQGNSKFSASGYDVLRIEAIARSVVDEFALDLVPVLHPLITAFCPAANISSIAKKSSAFFVDLQRVADMTRIRDDARQVSSLFVPFCSQHFVASHQHLFLFLQTAKQAAESVERQRPATHSPADRGRG